MSKQKASKVVTKKREPLLPMPKGVNVGKSSHPGVWRADGSGYPIKRRGK